MGIEEARARIAHIQGMTLGLRADGASSALASGQDPSAFAAALAGATPGGAEGAAAAAVAGVQAPPGSTGLENDPRALGIEAMLSARGVGTGAARAPRATMLTGDLEGLDAGLLDRLERVAHDIGKKIDVVSGHRTHEEQAELYQAYLNGTGNLAAPPGSSNHESGDAADVYVDGVALASYSGGSEAAERAGLHFPVGGEPWHIEVR